jgi:hypothetical protein
MLRRNNRCPLRYGMRFPGSAALPLRYSGAATHGELSPFELAAALRGRRFFSEEAQTAGPAARLLHESNNMSFL